MQRPGDHKGWHGRGYLPHFDRPDRVQHVVFRLYGSLPKHLLDPLSTMPAAERRLAMDGLLDQGHGPRWLAEPKCAALVVDALRFFDERRYRLLAWCVMSNHVHVVIEQVEGWPLGGVVASWKTYTAHEINRLTGRNGRFWAKDYFDRYVRDGGSLAQVIEYVERNPVTAGLCRAPEHWPWSSAGRHSLRDEVIERLF
jgi:putative transposase